ncbi:MAG: NAD-dependent epimerase/dehydratase family protein [Clostridia bacterium]|nr:NAD-dependent epimerase/dehydratase family protein [Clostridia bacterium]
MKKILITGANSYIGTAFENYISKYDNLYEVDTLDMLCASWRERSFADYDAILHVAGIAHRKETPENAQLYFDINRDLALEVAKKAKADGVKHFVFLSSMSVYGTDTGEITADTVPSPTSNYGKSKLEAEKLLSEIETDNFKIAMLRPPMVYGKDCRGNFQLMLKLIKKSPVFPYINNKRSMISINNLCSFVKLIIDGSHSGVFFPQNREYVNTLDMAKIIAKSLNKHVLFSRLLGLCVKILIPFVSKAKKAFGSLTYKNLEQFDFCYCEESFSDSVTNSI